MPLIYLIGSLRNPGIPALATKLRGAGFEVFDDWHSAGPTADDEWKRYEEERGRDYEQALGGLAARHVFDFDRHHLERCDLAVLAMPAGRSGHLELGYVIGKGKPGYVLMDRPDRWDVMYQFASGVCFSEDDLVNTLVIAEIPKADWREQQVGWRPTSTAEVTFV